MIRPTFLPLILASSLGAHAAVTISSTAPTSDAAEISNLSWTNNLMEKAWIDSPNLGQSFATGGDTDGYLLSSFSMQVNTSSSTNPADKVWNIRVVTISGITTSTLRLETGHTSSGAWSEGQWFTWTLNTPLVLDANTLYGVDVEMTSGGAWQLGLPYFLYSASDQVSGGRRYTRDDGDPSTISANTGPQQVYDRVFHVDLTVIPEPSSSLLGVLYSLSLLRRRIKRQSTGSV